MNYFLLFATYSFPNSTNPYNIYIRQLYLSHYVLRVLKTSLCHKNSKTNKASNFFDNIFAPKLVFWKNHYWVASVIDCFEPIFGFLVQFCFQKYRSDTWNPKGMFSALSGHSVYSLSINYQPSGSIKTMPQY